jgi:pectate lyase
MNMKRPVITCCAAAPRCNSRRVRAAAVHAAVATTLVGLSHAPAQALPAFPGAEGFGAEAAGGRGGEVYHVTNLNDSGPGSFRDAVSKGPRIVVFDVGGVVEIKSPVSIAGNITIVGQTSPGQGITIYGDSVSLSNSSNVIVRYIRFRQGIESGRGSKALNVTSGSNMIFDHVSAQWGRWDTIGVTKNSSKITFQYCLIGESIDPQRFGGLIDSSSEITLSHNLWINNQSRSPKIKGNLQYINNVVYNWGASGVPGGHSVAIWRQDVINNYFIKGPSSSADKALDMFASTDHVYQTGNYADLDKDGTLGGRAVAESDYGGETHPTFQTTPSNKPPIPVTVDSAQEAYEKIVAGAGASLQRDAVDERLIGYLTSQGTQGAVIHRESEVGGQPTTAVVTLPPDFDTDRDGMPDAWERNNGLNPNDASDARGTADGSGYTNIEKYINSLSGA